jgi:hypothetical protein
MSLLSCIPVIPSAELDKTLRLWVEGLGFSLESEMREEGRLTFCMLRKDHLCFMLNQRAGPPRRRMVMRVSGSIGLPPTSTRQGNG